jgi:hypothetical protein
VIPKISLVAFEERYNSFIFVAIPNQRGRYLRTDKSVALVACPICEAAIGEPCRSRYGDGYSCTTHCDRRTKAQLQGHRGAISGDIEESALDIELIGLLKEARTTLSAVSWMSPGSKLVERIDAAIAKPRNAQ